LYKIIGATRVCTGGTVLSPWTPDCKCGFSEGDRRVNIGFSTSFVLQPNHFLKIKITNTEPQPLDKCTVCFWGQDITSSVMRGLKEELDIAKREMEDSFGIIDLRPYLQQAWNKLSDVYLLPNLGYLSLQPKKLRMENIAVKNDLLNIDLGITATPSVSFIKPDIDKTVVPNLSGTSTNGGFSINLEAALQYDSLSKVINGFLFNKRFEVSEGLIKKHIVIKESKVRSGSNNNLIIAAEFSGSHNGTVYFTGKPFYNEASKKIELQDFDYDLKTKDFLLKAAKWLFDKRIVAEIKKHTVIDLSTYYNTAANTMNTWLNKEWAKGIKGSGKIAEVKLTGVYALPQHLLIRTSCSGALNVLVNESHLNF
ncbi:MAG TPA: DUF4403 family protein, partial [Chitinophagaceae bacterium]|nr:DUF4403 family protein [Chitinophagaceae bacterium]